MSLSKIALFAFGLAAILVAGSVNADAAMRNNGRTNGWFKPYTSVSSGATIRSAEDALFDRAKNGPY